MDWGLAGAVTLIGLLVVFAILLLLVFFCWALGKLMARGKSSGGKGPEKKETPKQAAAPVVKKPAAPAMQEDEGVLAAISAAVACMMEGKPFTIRSIRRADRPARMGRNPWNAAGIAENTRVF